MRILFVDFFYCKVVARAAKRQGGVAGLSARHGVAAAGEEGLAHHSRVTRQTAAH